MLKTLFVKWASPIFFSLFLQEDRHLTTIGTDCPWTFKPDDLDSDSKIISAGIGGDITFELELVRRYGCQVLLLDPSPTGLKTIEKLQPLPEKMEFLPVGLAAQSGVRTFSDPIYPDEGSFRLASNLEGGKKYQWDCYSLVDILKRKGWPSIALLKMDIEGFEYDVLSKLSQNKIFVSQICVELHYGKEYPYQFRQVIACVLNLRLQGYKLIHRYMNDFTFVKIEPPA